MTSTEEHSQLRGRTGNFNIATAFRETNGHGSLGIPYDSETNMLGTNCFSKIYSIQAINSRSHNAEKRKIFGTVTFTERVGWELYGFPTRAS